MSERKAKPEDLREACIQEALGIIETAGVEKLSLREVSRRLGVSHQAPYKHFPSRDHILAEIVARAFASFARYLEARPRTGDPDGDLGEMGKAYFSYAMAHPLQYRLMFGTPLPDPAEHPEMMRQSRHAFSLLREGIGDLESVLPIPDAVPGTEGYADELDALFIWATIHGMASILQSHTLQTLGLPNEVVEASPFHALQRIGVAMGKASTAEPAPPVPDDAAP
ncbi:MAG: TetR/AcrR family transcriptional regulator [Acidobacteriota bacterium]